MSTLTRKITALTAIGVLATAYLVAADAPRASGADRAFEARLEAASPQVRAIAQEVGLETFDGCAEALTYFRDNAEPLVTAFGFAGGFAFGRGMEGVVTLNDSAAEFAPKAAAPTASGAIAEDGTNFSTTNVQEEGVDEPDSIKTDGSTIFTVRGDVVYAVGTGTSLDVLDRIRLRDTWDAQLLLTGDRLVAITSGGNLVGAERDSRRPWRQSTDLTMIDVSDPSNMRIVETLTVEGWYVSARMVDGIVRVVIRTSGPAIAFAQPDFSRGEPDYDAIKADNERLVAGSTLEAWVPRYALTTGIEAAPLNDEPLTPCDRIRHPKDFGGFDMVSVLTVDPADPRPRDAATVVGAGDTVYASTDTLYVSTSNWSGGVPVPLGVPVPAAELIDPVSDDVVSSEGSISNGGGGSVPSSGSATAEAPPSLVDETTGDDEPFVDEPIPVEPRFAPQVQKLSTTIHAFDISDPVKASYIASGEIPGTLLNQWSLSEHDGHLRVVTTTTTPRGRTVSRLTTMTIDGPALTPTGFVNGLGPTERVYAVRFIGDMAYVVTFRQVDPLYVLDLSDPANPVVRGELKIPGFSAYLHPVGDGTLLGIGQDASLEGRTLGVQASLFDVSDPDDPTQVDIVKFGNNTYSTVQDDHRAFLYWAATTDAFVPVSGWDARTGRNESGLSRLHIDGDTLSGDGFVQHPAINRDGIDKPVPEELFDEAYFIDERPQIERAVMIGDTLYTLSYAGMLASNADTLDDVSWLAWPNQ